MRDDLQQAFETRRWRHGAHQSRSGDGSSLPATERLRNAMPKLFDDYGIQSFLDAPCGDWFWMQHVDLSGIHYIGADISGEIIEDLKTLSLIHI